MSLPGMHITLSVNHQYLFRNNISKTFLSFLFPVQMFGSYLTMITYSGKALLSKFSYHYCFCKTIQHTIYSEQCLLQLSFASSRNLGCRLNSATTSICIAPNFGCSLKKHSNSRIRCYGRLLQLSYASPQDLRCRLKISVITTIRIAL